MEIQKKTMDDVLKEQPKVKQKKSKPCTSCKKKPEVEELPTPQIIELVTKEEVMFLYTEMTRKSYTDEMYNQLNLIYSLLFNEPFNRCQGCDMRQYRKVKYYVEKNYPNK